VEEAMSEAILDSREPATVAPSVLAGWAGLKSLPARWQRRRRLGASIAHLDDRLLADVGLDPSDLGLGQRLIRRFVPGGDIWPLDRAGR
jgi:uncharacterized protein YjiS (DUF1127 family)